MGINVIALVSLVYICFVFLSMTMILNQADGQTLVNT